MLLFCLDEKFITFRNEVTNIGYPTNGPVSIEAGIRECSVEITNVSRNNQHSGRWTCFLSKANNIGGNLWKEATNYDVNFFTPAKMEITILTSGLDHQLDNNKYENMVTVIHPFNTGMKINVIVFS